MLKPRIIPCLDVKDGRVVKGVNFVDLIDAGDPVEQAKIYNDQGADELCLLDITASSDNRDTIYDVVTRVAETCFIPLTVGGGVRTLEDIRKLLNAGADKVSINSAAVSNPEFVREAAAKFGSQCIVVAIDAKLSVGGDAVVPNGNNALREVSLQESEKNCQEPAEAAKPFDCSGTEQQIAQKNCQEPAEAVDLIDRSGTERQFVGNKYEIFTHGGRNATGINAVEWAIRMTDYGAGELLVTSMDRDGTKQGFDIPMTRAIADAVNVPVIASGGVGAPEHFAQGVREGGATGLLAASIFHFGTHTIAEVKQAMIADGIAMRVVAA